MRVYAQVLLLFLLTIVLVGCSSTQVKHDSNIAVVFVSPDGNDNWSGTIPDAKRTNGPFATFERARDAVRAIMQNHTNQFERAIVYMRGGVYQRSQSFELTELDRNTQYLPWKDEVVRIVGGIEIDGFQPVLSIPQKQRHPALAMINSSLLRNILYVNLKDQGILDFGKLTPRGFGRGNSPAALELFYAERPMTLAQWPNHEWSNIAEVSAANDGDRFSYKGDRPNRWQHENDIWTHGYWTWDWADSYAKVKDIDITTKEIITQAPHGVYGYKKGQRFRVLNVLAELDSPGEWYLDRKSGMLYFWPPQPIEKTKPVVSILEKPLITINNASNIQIGCDSKRNLIIEATRGSGIVIEDGSNNRISGCVLRNIGANAITITNGLKHTAYGCEIHHTGDGGIYITGGDRNTLTIAGHAVINNHIHDYSRWSRTYNPAIRISGVGNRAAHNHIHDAPHAGIIFGGNENVIEYNEIDHICQDTGDVGAIYMGRDWTMRGNVIRHNFIHDLLGPFTHGAMAVYLDDAASGTTIYGNVFYKASHATFVGGGRDNTIENNIFVDCDPSVHIDARGIGWAAKHIKKGAGWHMYQKLEAMNYLKPPYSIRYPKLVNILDEKPDLPMGNVVSRNVSVGGKWLNLSHVKEEWVLFENNYVDKNPLFVNRDEMNFQLKDESPVYKTGFKKIPFEKIGTYDLQ